MLTQETKMPIVLPTNTMAVKRLLVIDDEYSIREVLKYCLEELAGWTVTTAQSGNEGLAIAREEEIDGILLDIMMPEMDGFTFLKHIKSDPTTRDIPVLMITAKLDLATHAGGNLDIVGAIAKPFDPLTLPDQIAQYLGWKP
jgi:CheY-like chemotaxis protein